MAGDVTFIHLSDLHLGDPAVPDPTLLSDTGATMAAVLAALSGLAPAPSFFAVSGDLTNRGDPASYAVLRDAIARLPGPAVLSLGNHDEPAGFAAVFPEAGETVRDSLIDGVHVVALDTGLPGRIGGGIDGAGFAKLEAALGRHGEAPKVLVMHHPPALGGERDWKTIGPDATRRLAETLARHPVSAILTGHIHLDRVVIWEGVPVVTVSGQHAATDALHGPGLRSVRGASFGLCRLGPAGFSVTFVQLPSNREELESLPPETVTAFV